MSLSTIKLGADEFLPERPLTKSETKCLTAELDRVTPAAYVAAATDGHCVALHCLGDDQQLHTLGYDPLYGGWRLIGIWDPGQTDARVEGVRGWAYDTLPLEYAANLKYNIGTPEIPSDPPA